MSSAHVVPVRVYLAVFVSLLVLTGTTVAVAFVDLGPLNNVVAMGIAGCKAALVLLFFMGVRYATKLTPLVIGSGLFALLIMVGLTLADYGSRGGARGPRRKG